MKKILMLLVVFYSMASLAESNISKCKVYEFGPGYLKTKDWYKEEHQLQSLSPTEDMKYNLGVKVNDVDVKVMLIDSKIFYSMSVDSRAIKMKGMEFLQADQTFFWSNSFIVDEVTYRVFCK